MTLSLPSGRARHEPETDRHGTENSRQPVAVSVEDMTTVTRVHAVVSGTVQGVGFRYWTARKADGLDLVGYARNLWDGTVEVEAEGPSVAVDSLVECLRTGPPSATVTDVSLRSVVPHGDADGFAILH
jgi:acylphosphatase